jgi:hypothetical protein
MVIVLIYVQAAGAIGGAASSLVRVPTEVSNFTLDIANYFLLL